jgi:hypothetical protein
VVEEIPPRAEAERAGRRPDAAETPPLDAHDISETSRRALDIGQFLVLRK